MELQKTLNGDFVEKGKYHDSIQIKLYGDSYIRKILSEVHWIGGGTFKTDFINSANIKIEGEKLIDDRRIIEKWRHLDIVATIEGTGIYSSSKIKIIIEIKPRVSYGDNLRQMKVYKKSLKSNTEFWDCENRYLILTYNIEQGTKECFEKEGISVLRIE